jgi:hypothetical protein
MKSAEQENKKTGTDHKEPFPALQENQACAQTKKRNNEAGSRQK